MNLNLIKEKTKLWLNKKENILLLIIIVLAFLIRLKYMTINSAVWWDEADYLSAAKRWGGLSYLNDIWYYRRTPLLPLFWAGLYKLGATEITLRFTEVIFSTLFVFGIYLLAKEIFNNKYVGLIAASCAIFNRIHLFLTTRLMNEVPATPFLVFGLYFFWKGYIKEEKAKYMYLATFMLSISIMTRMATSLVLVPIGVYVLSKERLNIIKNKKVWICLLMILLTMTPFIYLHYKHIGGLTNFIKHYTITEDSTEIVIPSIYLGYKGISIYFMSYLQNLGIIFFIIFIIAIGYYFYPLILAPDLLIKKENNEIKEKLLVALIILVPLIYHGIFSEYLEERYLLWSYPIVYALIAWILFKIYTPLTKYGKNIAITLIIVIIITNSYLVYQSTEEIINYKKDSYYEERQAAEFVKSISTKEDLIYTNPVPKIVYYSERKTLNFNSAGSAENIKESAKKNNAKYLIFSLIEQSSPWAKEMITYPPEWLKLIKVFPSEQNPVVFVFEIQKDV
ncbi:MAG TPA: glycosyltransferase family 39 protein [Candidatus Nanoarchaeia archaeon]|nr:glycosyltransferase family 39 protein [Candidatus Nanoarchaeia archaeon]